ncbi:MAG TPA: histone deacetylase [Thermoanaerobaculia bacterium]|jgi:acetoin utilization deacetylase AcuC-like enzyme|nr:histone deacetylase [Thermoanaerobaculia bacterium]
MDVVTDPRCLLHDVPLGFPEQPSRLATILAGLRGRGRSITEPGAHEASRALVEQVHSAAYVSRFHAAVERGDGLFDSADNPLVATTWDAAWGAVDATLHAADRALAGTAVFAAVRPPGHHAEKQLAMGFCWFNNAAVAAERLRAQGLARVAIFDFDVHHGNGTQHIFEERADVFYASTHQYPFYPGTGAASERGYGEGLGATLNVPLRAGCDDGEYAQAIEGVVLPALRAFAPQALVVSAGFDAWQNDPLGGMRVSEEGFAQWGRWLGQLAREACGGRLVALLEGGYDVPSLPRLVEAFLAGVEADV